MQGQLLIEDLLDAAKGSSEFNIKLITKWFALHLF